MHLTFTLLFTLFFASGFSQKGLSADSLPATKIPGQVLAMADSVAVAGKPVYLLHEIVAGVYRRPNFPVSSSHYTENLTTIQPGPLPVSTSGFSMRTQPMNLVVYDMRTFPSFKKAAELDKKARLIHSVGLSLVGVASYIADANQASNNGLPLFVVPQNVNRFINPSLIIR